MDAEVTKYLFPCLSMHTTKNICVDATVGLGGHSLRLLSLYDNCSYQEQCASSIADPCFTLIANDVDSEMLAMAQKNLIEYTHCVQFYNMWFDDLFSHLQQKNSTVQAILFDLGVSMYHFIHSQRGFSWQGDEFLDMRLNNKETTKAFDIVNTYTEHELSTVFRMYGEERQAVKWARRIQSYRKEQHIQSVSDICHALQLGKKMQDRSILSRLFQALRIEVNNELLRIQRALPVAWSLLAKGGRMAVISFHSLEDRIVKHFSRIVQGKLKISEFFPNINNIYSNSGVALHKKPLVPSTDEVNANKASRSAKLRVLEKIV